MKHPAFMLDACQAYKLDTSQELGWYTHKINKLLNKSSRYKIVVDRKIFQNYMCVCMCECESCGSSNPLAKDIGC